MKAIKVQFKKLGKRYFFGCEKFNIKNGDKVIVNTIRGLELGEAVGEVFDLKPEDLQSELKDIVRIATEKDICQWEENISEEADIVKNTKFLAKKNKLEIKVLGADYTLDRSKLIIYFESEGRVDFRELVKNLAESYHTRIELRQVGSRDGAKVFGGIGPCGLVVCCKTFLTEFNNVSIKMAKNQSLSLNTLKISGNCGKLLCCISYENDVYTELRKHAPDVGDIVSSENGNAKVLTADVLNHNLKVKYLENEGFGYLKFEDVKILQKKHKKEEAIENDSELKALE